MAAGQPANNAPSEKGRDVVMYRRVSILTICWFCGLAAMLSSALAFGQFQQVPFSRPLLQPGSGQPGSGQLGSGQLGSGQLQSSRLWLEDGAQLEAAGRWAEAVAHYERALRESGLATGIDRDSKTPDHPLTQALSRATLRYVDDLHAAHRYGEAMTLCEEKRRAYFPNNRQLLEQLTLSRIHYTTSRRYRDESFRQSLTALGEQGSLDLLKEVLQKIHSHYVHKAEWQDLVDYGTRAMCVALSNPKFAQEHLKDVPPEWTASFKRELQRRMSLTIPRSRQEVAEAVRMAGQLGRSRLGLPPSAVILEYTHQMVVTLDDYSTYLTGNQLNDLYAQIDGNFVGLGIELQADEDALRIVDVISGSPAAEAGLKVEDRIIAVDGRPLTGLSTDQGASLLQGPEGSLVRLTVETLTHQESLVQQQNNPVQAPSQPPSQVLGRPLPDGTFPSLRRQAHRTPQRTRSQQPHPRQIPRQREVQVRRRRVEVPSIEGLRIVDQQSGLGYLRLTSFQKTTVRELDSALWSLQRRGMRSLVMDLRGNPGGLLTTAVDVADRFIESGRIVSTRGRSPDQNWTYSAHAGGPWGRTPLIVLIDRDSASAAEIFAGAIRDHRRGWILGERSYGKGSVQSIFALSQASAGLRLTTAKFYSPQGQAYSKVGVKPHIVVSSDAEAVAATGQLTANAEDAVLVEAVRVAREHFGSRR